jgi:glutamine synthetase adenylyltransferase
MPDATEWQAEFAARLAGCDYEASLRCMRRFQAEEILRIGVHDVAGNLAHAEVSAQLARLAEACLRNRQAGWPRIWRPATAAPTPS